MHSVAGEMICFLLFCCVFFKDLVVFLSLTAHCAVQPCPAIAEQWAAPALFQLKWLSFSVKNSILVSLAQRKCSFVNSSWVAICPLSQSVEWLFSMERWRVALLEGCLVPWKFCNWHQCDINDFDQCLSYLCSTIFPLCLKQSDRCFLTCKHYSNIVSGTLSLQTKQ